jgi:hypothetical protein
VHAVDDASIMHAVAAGTLERDGQIGQKRAVTCANLGTNPLTHARMCAPLAHRWLSTWHDMHATASLRLLCSPRLAWPAALRLPLSFSFSSNLPTHPPPPDLPHDAALT